MDQKSLLELIGAGRAVAAVFDVGADEQALIEIWTHEGRIILTWEQCRHGDQFNESSYTRDERQVFDAAWEVWAFLERNAVPIEAFGDS